ncbi:hypothetical protein [Jannaschia formosa]|uniref:hypothetical protein n=1 Tax=Jannaschia formosa TaxID=2259592 RepID=UPI000E1BFC12|nr:hypothetical protein [Jannaschia formosa]TFL19241.1 hypothetical protein DR046_04740 [Jannaschia formosa]
MPFRPRTFRIPASARRLRHLALLLLLLASGAILAGRVLGPGETDIASELTGVTDASLEPPAELPLADRPIARATSGEGGCAVRAEAVPQHAAMIALTVAAPCHAGNRVDIVQGELGVTVRLDAEGHAALSLPALSGSPTLAVRVAEAEPVQLLTWVSDFDRYQRAVLQWGGRPGLQLHAFENGSGWGGAGHVGPDAPRAVADAIAGTGGFLVRLGDAEVSDGLGALVYTAPAAVPVALTLEAPVTAETCGRHIDAAAFRVGPGLAPAPQPVALTVPGCQAVGDAVLIDGLLDARVAAVR